MPMRSLLPMYPYFAPFRAGSVSLLFLSVACAAPQLQQFPTVEVPIESQPEREEIPAPAMAQKPAPKVDDLPDPKAHNSQFQLDYLLGYEKGEMVLLSQEAVLLETPKPTDRRFGRFALELWVGKELLERARFDFPLLGAGTEDTEGIEAGLSAQVKVRIPEVSRARRARLVDRKTGETLELPWPPRASNYNSDAATSEN